MNITEVKVKLVESPKDRLKAFCSITIDDMFVVRDLKVIDGTKGTFVAMPSRKLTDKCPKCRGKNRLTAKFCNDCGTKLRKDDSESWIHKRVKLHADIAHPVTAECRDIIQERVLKAYEEELERSKEPGYALQEIYDSSNIYTDAESEIDAIEYAGTKSEDGEDQQKTQDTKGEEQSQNQTQDNSSDDDNDPFGAGIL